MCQVSSTKLSCNPCHTFTSLVMFIECLQTLVLNTKQWVYKHALLPYCVTFLNINNLLYTKTPCASTLIMYLLSFIKQSKPSVSSSKQVTSTNLKVQFNKTIHLCVHVVTKSRSFISLFNPSILSTMQYITYQLYKYNMLKYDYFPCPPPCGALCIVRD